MKSRTSFFNFTVFKKDITRFAPCWGLYTLMLLLGLFSLSNSSDPIDTATSIETLFSGIAPINMCYGLITATLLFGDLYNSRLCNALHAMPLRRESWFLTHVLSGLVFSLIPNMLFCLLALPILSLGNSSSILAWLLLAATLQYLFFFGLAVLCATLTGSRFAHILIYGIVNLASMLVYELVVALYQPLLYGIEANDYTYSLFSPAVYLSQCDFIQVLYEEVALRTPGGYAYILLGFSLANGWGYLAICALIGTGAFILGLALYRRRKLECAGDFLAFRAAEPLFLVILSLFVGIVLMLFAEIFVDISTRYVFLYLGLVIGFFGGLMLLRRTTQVFRPRAFVGMALIAAAFSLSVSLTKIDAFGIAHWIPRLEQVASVSVSNEPNWDNYRESILSVEDPQDIADILQAHQNALEEETNPAYAYYTYYTTPIHLQYKLKNGRTVERFYNVRTDSEAGQLLKPYLSSIECVLGITEEEIPKFANYITLLDVSGHALIELPDILEFDMEEFLRAIAADCKAGNMAQTESYYLFATSDTLDDSGPVACGLYLELLRKDAASDTTYRRYINFLVYDCSENTLAWLTENGLYPTENTAK